MQRCVGPKHDVESFPVYAAAALAGLGELPDTIMSRAIIIRMRRRGPDESVEQFRHRDQAEPGLSLRRLLAAWGATVGWTVGAATPQLPEGIVDRASELWEPLIALADAAGGHWPTSSRAACVSLCRSALNRRASLGVRLLADLRVIFGDTDALHTRTVLERLRKAEESGLAADAPWAELHGKGLGERALASMLRPYGVISVKVRAGGEPRQGYRREHLWDAWQRYLPSTPVQAEQGELPEPGVPAVPDVPPSRIPEVDK